MKRNNLAIIGLICAVICVALGIVYRFANSGYYLLWGKHRNSDSPVPAQPAKETSTDIEFIKDPVAVRAGRL